MQRCVAPQRSALSLSLLSALSECAGPLHAAVCSSAPQCLEPFPTAPIVRIAPQDHRVHLLGVTRHGCARSEQKHGSAQVRCVCPLCAVASRSATRAIPLFNLGHQRNATFTNDGKTALTSALLRAAKRASTRRRGPERRLRARVQCPWQCCQPGAPPFSALRKNPAFLLLSPFLGGTGGQH